VRAAVRRVADSGVEVVLATGRSPWFGIAELASLLELDGVHVALQGALVFEPATGVVHRLRVLPPAVYHEAIAFADEHGLDPVVALPNGHRAERLGDAVDFVSPPVLGGETRTFRYVSRLEALVDERPVRVFLPTGPDRHQAIRAALRDRFGGRASIVWSDRSGVELLAPGTGKGEALAWLAELRGFGLDAVAAVGDAANDVDMLRMAGRSAAMGSAPADVRLAASITVPSNARDGIVDALAWFFPDLAW
jgi:HAD superfamily hydrolase (TIGR01484 family)